MILFYRLSNYEYSITHADEILREELQKTKNTIKEIFQVLPLTIEGAEIFGELKNAYLNKTGISKKAVNRHTQKRHLGSNHE